MYGFYSGLCFRSDLFYAVGKLIRPASEPKQGVVSSVSK